MKTKSLLTAALLILCPSVSVFGQPQRRGFEFGGAVGPVKLGITSSSNSNYQLPEVKISGPESVRSGRRMVVVRAAIDRAKLPENLIAANFQWSVLVNGKPEPEVLIWPDNSLISFPSSEEESVTTVILDIDCLFGVEKEVDGKPTYEGVELVSSQLITHAIDVTDGGSPGPGPKPNPDPPSPQPVDPVFPPSRYGLSEFIYKAVKTDTSLSQSEKVALSSALASSYQGIASKIAAISTYTDVVKILTETSEFNKAAITSSGVAREKTLNLNKILGDKIYQLTASKDAEIQTAQDIKDAWTEIAQGFAAIK